MPAWKRRSSSSSSGAQPRPGQQAPTFLEETRYIKALLVPMVRCRTHLNIGVLFYSPLAWKGGKGTSPLLLNTASSQQRAPKC